MAYKRQMTGEGLTYQERQRVIVKCSEHGEEMVKGLLEVHQQTHHAVEYGGIRQWDTSPPDGEPRTYRMSFPNLGGLQA